MTSNAYESENLTLLDAALLYASAGFAVFPLRPQSKEPIGGSHGCKDATKDVKLIKEWWSATPHANVGIATGPESGVVVLDVDEKGAKNGEASLKKLEAENEKLPETVQAITPSGGRHLYFRAPDANIKNSAGKLGEGLDVRGTGGYVVAAPSTLGFGKEYSWQPGRKLGEFELAEPPHWLAELIETSSSAPATPPDGTITQGERNWSLFRIGCSLRSKGKSGADILEALRKENADRCNPPLCESEVQKIAGSCAKYDPGRTAALKESEAAKIITPNLSGRYAWDRGSRQWFRYTGTIWASVPTDEIEQTVMLRLEIIVEKFTSRYLKGVAELLRHHLAAPRWNADTSLLPFSNAALDLPTNTLVPYTPELAFNWRLPYDFLPEAECPTFRSWLEQSVNAADVPLIRSWLNAVLRGFSQTQRFLEVFGPPASGKSTLMNLARQLVGPENTVTTDLSELSRNRYETASMRYKRLVLITDSEPYSGSLATFKAMTGGDPIRCEQKYVQQSENFVFKGLVMVAGNLPVVPVGGDSAISRRRIMVRFPHTVPPEKRDPRLLESLCKELPGIAAWSFALSTDEVESMLLKPPISENGAAYLPTSTPLGEWANDCLILDEKAKTQVGNLGDHASRLYPNHVAWCQQKGHECVSLKQFSSLLIDLFADAEMNVSKRRTSKGIFIKGIRLRTPDDEVPQPLLDATPQGVG